MQVLEKHDTEYKCRIGYQGTTIETMFAYPKCALLESAAESNYPVKKLEKLASEKSIDYDKHL